MGLVASRGAAVIHIPQSLNRNIRVDLGDPLEDPVCEQNQPVGDGPAPGGLLPDPRGRIILALFRILGGELPVRHVEPIPHRNSRSKHLGEVSIELTEHGLGHDVGQLWIGPAKGAAS